MEKKYIIGVDGGSQSTKILIFDYEGNIICEGREDLKPMNLPEPGIVEHPDDDLWTSLCIASKKALEKFPGKLEEIVGVGLCTIRFCRCLLKGDGTLASPAMSWMDARVSRPYEHINPEVKYVTTTSGYVTHRFTGKFNDTAANYQGQWPMDTDTWEWSEDDEVIKNLGIPRDMLFHMQMPGSVLGYVTKAASEATGIPEGLPVVATANDKAVEALGAGSLGENTSLVSLGTYITSMIHGKDNPKDTTNFWTNFACVPNRYLYESTGIRRGMWTVSWFKDLFGDEIVRKGEELGLSAEDYLNQEAANVPAGCDGLMTVLDWLAPTHAPYKKGMMIGFDGRHTRAHMFRSILEAIALTMKYHSDAMCEELGIKLDSIVVSGGGSNSDLFMQIFADVFGVPASRNVVNGAAGLGSAICAAVGTGVYDGFDTAVKNMVKLRDTFAPIAAHTELYNRMNKEVYSDITKYTDEIFKKSYPIFK